MIVIIVVVVDALVAVVVVVSVMILQAWLARGCYACCSFRTLAEGFLQALVGFSNDLDHDVSEQILIHQGLRKIQHVTTASLAELTQSSLPVT